MPRSVGILNTVLELWRLFCLSRRHEPGSQLPNDCFMCVLGAIILYSENKDYSDVSG